MAIKKIMVVDDSPTERAFMEGVLKKRGYEVLYMTDPVDEWAAQGLREFQDKPLVSAMHADLKLEETDEEKREKEERAKGLGPLADRMKEVLKEHVREVRVSDRLTDSPCCLVVPEGGSHAFVERLLRERGLGVPRAKRILEVNPAHPIIEHLRALNEKEAGSPQVTEWVEMLYDQALLTEGSSVEDPNRFARRMTALMTQLAGPPKHTPAGAVAAGPETPTSEAEPSEGAAVAAGPETPVRPN